MITNRWLAAFTAVTACVGVVLGSTEARAEGVFQGRLERPVAHSNLGPTGSATTSGIKRTFTCTDLSFEYGLDSESGFDELRVYVANVLRFSQSGASKRGKINLPLGGAAAEVRFEYFKDGSVDKWRDTAWVDKILCMPPTGAPTYFNFDDPSTALDSSWTSYGYGGGWTKRNVPRGVALSRPASQAFKGYQPAATTSEAQRCFDWPVGTTRGSITFDYSVDSELNYDYLKIEIDGVEVLAKSGPGVTGRFHQAISGGNHCIKFKYTKDTSVDAFGDTARVDNIVPMVDSTPIEVDDFDGAAVGAPLANVNWTCSIANCWNVELNSPARAFARRSTAAAPVVDAALTKNEYVDGTELVTRDPADHTSQSRVSLRVDATGQRLFMLIPFNTYGSPGSYMTGTMRVMLDGNHDRTIGAADCKAADGSIAPNVEDRRFDIAFSIPVGTAVVNGLVASITQYKGTCNAASPWIATSNTDSWAIAARLSNTLESFSASDVRNHSLVELAITLKSPADTTSAILSQRAFGLGLRHLVAGLSSSGVTLPGYDFERPLDNSTATWHTIELLDAVSSPAIKTEYHSMNGVFIQ